MNIQDLIDDCNKQIEWVNNKDEYNVNALQFASYFKERLIEINDRTCESCKYFDDIYCTNLHIDSMVDEFDELTNFVRVFKNFSCNKWESKDD
jgi:hypothetical protein